MCAWCMVSTHGHNPCLPMALPLMKVDAIRAGTALVLACRAKRQYNEVVMDASAKLLKVVPEVRQS